MYVLVYHNQKTKQWSCFLIHIQTFISDIDECAEKTDGCDVNADCENTDGSHECHCKPTYTGNGTYCEAGIVPTLS